MPCGMRGVLQSWINFLHGALDFKSQLPAGKGGGVEGARLFKVLSSEKRKTLRFESLADELIVVRSWWKNVGKKVTHPPGLEEAGRGASLAHSRYKLDLKIQSFAFAIVTKQNNTKRRALAF